MGEGSVTPEYCVIGAGAAGLATIRGLRDRGFAFDCFEQTDRVGGHWHTDYECLHLITPRDTSGFVGYPMPSSYPHFPSRQQVVDYLESFACNQRLYEHITFDTTVASVTPMGPAGTEGWKVRLASGEERRYRGVVVCNGHLWDPLLPDYPGTFSGKSIHSSAYHNLDDVEGDRVLVVGAGNSGCDIAVEIAQARLSASVSMRSGQLFQPKTLFGRPRALLGIAKLPPRLNELATVALMNVVHGSPRRYGMPAPPSNRLGDSRPVVNSQLLHWIHHGRVAVVPGIEALDGRTVHFTDGSSREFDTIVWATGFNVTFPFLDSRLLSWRNGVPLRYAATTVPAGLENLYFVGLGAPRGAQLPTYDLETELVANMLRLHEQQDIALAAEFARTEQPEWRIDMLPHEWKRQLQHARRLVGRLAAGGNGSHRSPRGSFAGAALTSTSRQER